jgi:hypothetical protein
MNYLVNPGVSEEIDDSLTGNIIGAAIDVHRALGPGLLESAYEACFAYELRLEDQVIIEIKSVSVIAPIHEAQLLSYLRLYGTCTRGLFINFNVKRLVEGIRRMKI